MKLINNILYLSADDIVDCGVSYNYIKRALSGNRNSELQSWQHIKDNGCIYICYDSLKEKYQILVQHKLCAGTDPYTFARNLAITNLLTLANEDNDFINAYKTEQNLYLSDYQKIEYKHALKYLNLLKQYKSKAAINSIGFQSKSMFYQAVISHIKQFGIKLPASEQRLVKKLHQYINLGASCIIHRNIANSNALKVTPDAKDIIVSIYAKPNQYNATQTTAAYNNIADKAGLKPVAPRTILNHIPHNEIQSLREGVDQWRNNFDLVVKRSRPSKPNYLWVGDGTPAELYFQSQKINADNHLQRNFWKRKYIYVVTDAFNDAVMGFAIGDSENEELIRKAWRNACVWQNVLPWQVKTDNFSRKALEPFFSELAEYFTPAAPGNARDKTIEQFFAKLNALVLKHYPNYSGANITAKNQPNRDFLQKIAKEFPTEPEVIEQLVAAFDAWNNIAREKLNGLSLYQHWATADHSQDRILSDLKRLELFGVAHKFSNTLTNKGITFSLNGQTRNYLILDTDFFASIGTQYQVIYDPDNLEKILIVAKDGKLRYLVNEDKPVPMAYKDMQEGDRTRLNQKLEFKKHIKETFILKSLEKRQDYLNANNLISLIEAEGAAKLGLPVNGTNKQLLNDSETALKQLSDNPQINQDDNDFYEQYYNTMKQKKINHQAPLPDNSDIY